MQKILLVLLFVPLCWASPNIDSLKNVLQTFDGIQKLSVLNDLAGATYYSDPKASLSYASSAVRLISLQADTSRFAHEKSLALLHMARAHFYLGEHETADSLAFSAYQCFLALEDTANIIFSANTLANALRIQGLLADAMLYFNQALELSLQTGDTLGCANASNNVAILYRSLMLHERALENYEKAKKAYEKLGLPRQSAVTLHNIGNVYGDMDSTRLALSHLARALTMARELEDRYLENSCLTNMAYGFLRLKELGNAKEYAWLALTSAQTADDIKLQAMTLAIMGDISIAERNNQAAFNYYHESLALAESANIAATKLHIYQQLAQIHRDRKELGKTIEWLERSIDLKEEIQNRETLSEFANIQKSSELRQSRDAIRTLKTQQQIQDIKLHNERRISKVLMFGLIILIVLLTIVVVLLVLQVEKRRQLQRAHDEIHVLRGILPICSSCKKIRTDEGYWNHIEVYIEQHSDAKFTHGICEECVKKLYPSFSKN
jgi:tetratricopeptide (TPR) repeat protein